MRLFVGFPQTTPIVVTWTRCEPAKQKRGSGGSMSAASPMIKSTKGVEKRRKGVSVVGVAYLSLKGSLCFIFELLLNFRKDNLVILVIRSLFPYQGLVLPYRGLMFLRSMRFGQWEIRG